MKKWLLMVAVMMLGALGGEAEGKNVEQLFDAAEKGDAKAQFEWGRCYQEGKGVDKDLNEAVKLYTEAGKQGNLDAQLALGFLYHSISSGMAGNGMVLQADGYEKMATEWFSKAAEQGNAVAECYMGVKTDDKRKKEEYLRRAAEHGSAEGLALWGRDFEKNRAQKAKCYYLAFKKNDFPLTNAGILFYMDA